MWQTRTICSFVAATVPFEPGQDNPLLEQAAAIGVVEPDENTNHTATAAAAPAAKEPDVGSYERFMSTFGDPRRWAGR